MPGPTSVTRRCDERDARRLEVFSAPSIINKASRRRSTITSEKRSITSPELGEARRQTDAPPQPSTSRRGAVASLRGGGGGIPLRGPSPDAEAGHGGTLILCTTN